MQKCTKCNITKDKEDFTIRTNRKKGYFSVCRSCTKKLGEEYKKTKIGVLRTIYAQQVSHSKKRGHRLPSYTSDEFVNLFIDNEKFITLWESWNNSGHKKDLKPSVDRIDNNLPYTVCNIYMTTWSENNIKCNNHQKEGLLNTTIPHKKVAKLDNNNKIIDEYISIRDAGRKNNLEPSKISLVCKNKRKTTGGFKWKYL